ncbi:hypothetical protein [Glycomyces salinus]|uniref:hypothetical protein n=1 Tax=Glycomyces salinus TaxID=980294 RepID=UPI0018EBEB7B|nr:hypothetical protein [Glycomyces salinus]
MILTLTVKSLLTGLSVISLLAVSGCGGAEDQQEPDTPAPSTAQSSPVAESTSEATESPDEPEWHLGDTIEFDSGSSATAIELEVDTAASSPAPSEAGYPANYVWAGLRVEICVPDTPPEDTTDDFYLVARDPWSLVSEGNALITPSHTGYSGFPQPEYPWGIQEVGIGTCVNGWIVFPVPDDEGIAKVQYARTGTSPEYWTVN